jgi:hypothetical protein
MSLEKAINKLNHYSIKMHKGVMLQGVREFQVYVENNSSLFSGKSAHYRTMRPATGDWQTSGIFQGTSDADLADAICVFLDECGIGYDLIRHGLNSYHIRAKRQIDDFDIDFVKTLWKDRKSS